MKNIKNYNEFLNESTEKTDELVTNLFSCIRKNDLSGVKTLIKNNPFLVDAEKNGRTPIVDAARKDNIQMVKFLLDNGADVTFANDRISDLSGAVLSAAYYAVVNDNIEMLNLLMDNDADLFMVDDIMKLVKSDDMRQYILSVNKNRR